MSEEVSWQKLIGIEVERNEERPSSPILLNNKWILPKKPICVSEVSSIQDFQTVNLRNHSFDPMRCVKRKKMTDESSILDVVDGENCMLSPIKTRRSSKRKSLDLTGPLTPKEPQTRSRTKIRRTALLKASQGTSFTETCEPEGQAKPLPQSSQSSQCSEGNSSVIKSIRKNLLYCENPKTQRCSSQVTITDIFKSVIMIEDASRTPVSKKSAPPLKPEGDFIKVSSLDKGNEVKIQPPVPKEDGPNIDSGCSSSQNSSFGDSSEGSLHVISQNVSVFENLEFETEQLFEDQKKAIKISNIEKKVVSQTERTTSLTPSNPRREIGSAFRKSLSLSTKNRHKVIVSEKTTPLAALADRRSKSFSSGSNFNANLNKEISAVNEDNLLTSPIHDFTLTTDRTSNEASQKSRESDEYTNTPKSHNYSSQNDRPVVSQNSESNQNEDDCLPESPTKTSRHSKRTSFGTSKATKLNFSDVIDEKLSLEPQQCNRTLNKTKKIEKSVPMSLDEPKQLEKSVSTSLDDPKKLEKSAPMSLDVPKTFEKSAPMSLDVPKTFEKSALMSLDEPDKIEESAPVSLDESSKFEKSTMSLDQSKQIEKSAPMSLDDPKKVEKSAPMILDVPKTFEKSALISLDEPEKIKESAPVSLDESSKFEKSTSMSLDEPEQYEKSAPMSLNEPNTFEKSSSLSLVESEELENSAPMILDEPEKPLETSVSKLDSLKNIKKRLGQVKGTLMSLCTARGRGAEHFIKPKSTSSLQKVLNLLEDILEDGHEYSLKTDFLSSKQEKSVQTEANEDIFPEKNSEKAKIELKFSSAGSAVSVSSGSLKEVQQLLDDVSESGSRSDNRCKLSTASGGDVVLSQESLKKAQELFKDDLYLNDSVPSPDDKQQILESPKKQARNTSKAKLFKKNLPEKQTSFITAAGGQIPVSEESWKKAQTMFDEDLTNDSLENYKETMKLTTANGETVSLSQQSLKKAQVLFDEVSSKDQPGSSKFLFKKGNTSNGSVSEEASKELRNANNFELTAVNSFKVPAAPKESLEPLNIGEVIDMCGQGFMFSTARGSNVKISGDSLNKVRNLFGDDLNLKNTGCISDITTNATNNINVTTNTNRQSTSTLVDSSRSTSFKSKMKENTGNTIPQSGDMKNKFLSQDNKSDETNRQVGKDLDIMLLDKSAEKVDKLNCSETRPRFMFSTASGNSIGVSAESLNKVKNLFADEFGELENPDAAANCKNDVSRNSSGKHIDNVLFSTAGGSNINISQESIRRVRNIFSDEDLQGICNQGLLFSSASGSKPDLTEETLKEKEVLSSNTSKSFVFSTAGGSKVGVSSESLQKVKQIFSDEVSEHSSDAHNLESIPVTGGKHTNDLKQRAMVSCDRAPQNPSSSFSTAGGSSVAFSAESLQRVRSLFGDDFAEDFAGPGASSQQNLGFTSAGSVSKGILEAIQPQKPMEKPVNDFGRKGSFMFSTAGGSTVSVSSESLKKVKEMFEDELAGETSGVPTNPESLIPLSKRIKESDPKQDLIASREHVPKSSGFSFLTAGGSSVAISAESLEKVKNLFGNDLAEEANQGESLGSSTGRSSTIDASKDSLVALLTHPKVTENNRLENIEQKKSFMFSTAGGSSVSVSSESLKKVKEMFEDELAGETSALPTNPESVMPLSKRIKESDPKQDLIASRDDAPKSSGFSFLTAGGSSVGISAESLEKVKNLFGNDLVEEADQGESLGSSIGASKESLATMLNHPKLTENDRSENIEQKRSFMFSTAGGSSVSVSSESLQKVRGMFDDLAEDASGQSASCQNFGSVMSGRMRDSGSKQDKIPSRNHGAQNSGFSFSTAGGSSVAVSAESLQKVKNLFGDDLAEEDNKANPEETTEVSNVKVSKKSIEVVLNQRCIENNTLRDVEPKFSFSTAGGSNVPISSESLRKVQNLFDDEINKSNIPMTSHTSADKVAGAEEIKNQSSQLKQHDFNPDDSLTGLFSQFEKEFQGSKQGISSNQKVDVNPALLNMSISNTQLELELNDLEKSSEHGFKLVQSSPSFSQTLGSEQLTTELNRIENLASSSKKEDTTGTNMSPITAELNSEIDVGDFCTPVNYKKRKSRAQSDDQQSSKVQILSQEIREMQDALIADDRIGNPYLPSPTNIFDRAHLKPLSTWNSAFDTDEDILAAAETLIKEAEPESDSHNFEKRRPEFELPSQPPVKKVKAFQEPDCAQLEEIRAARQQKREEQKQKITTKRNGRPSLGLYMSQRKNETLKKFMEPPFNKFHPYTFDQLLQYGIKEDLINVSSKNAVDFEFSAEEYFLKEEVFSNKGFIDLGSGFTVVLSDTNKIGLQEITDAFLSSPDVDPSLVPDGWVRNHFRWIVWKLASLEKSFPHLLHKRYLVPLNILHQLKYRYDREIELVQRPAFKKILECDEPSSRRFIASVADIRKVESEELENVVELELTDGWYSVWATVDSAMVNLVSQGKVVIGSKLVIHGAEILNCSEGCDPLKSHDGVRLKLSSNSCRRARWFSRLGFTRDPGPLNISLDSLLSDGGAVGCLTALIARVYPTVYMSKDPAGKTVIRNQQAENHFSASYEKERSLKSEELYETILKEVESKYKEEPLKNKDLKKVDEINDPKVLWCIVSREPEIQASLTTDQMRSVKQYHEHISSKINEEVQSILKEKLEELIPARKVTSLLKLRLVDPITEASAMLTIWRPAQDLRCLFKENSSMKFLSLVACGTRDRVVQLSSTKMTCYQEIAGHSQTEKFSRSKAHFGDLTNRQFFPSFGELDLAGVVVFVREPEVPWGVSNVYLSNLKNNFVMVTFWTSLKTFGCEGLLKEGSIVAGVNLSWRQGSGSYVVPSTFANELTYFTSSPTQAHLVAEITKLKEHFAKEEEVDKFVERRRSELLELVKERRGVSTTPVRRPEAASPRVAQRLERLKAYGTPPPLPLMPISLSPQVRQGFKSPRPPTQLPLSDSGQN